MPTLEKTEFTGEVVWLGHVSGEVKTIRSGSATQIDLGFDGQAGARHAGVNRASCIRVRNLYAEDTEIRNVRQLTILSAEQLEAIAAEMKVDTLDPGLLGATLVLRGIPDFTHIPPSSRLQAPSGLTLTVDMENRPCLYPAREIEMEQPGHGAAFKPAAKNRRGVTAWVERPGTIAVGDTLTLFIPDQRAWAPT
jgi:hypothetical protein